MASAASKTRIYNFDDFCTLVGDGQKGDLIDGVIYVASPDNTAANDINLWLASLIWDFVEYFELGRVFVSKVACKLDEYNAPEPDIVFISKQNEGQIVRGRINGPPDLAVEIVSPDSVERDYQKKRVQYERFGIKEYWIIDEIEETALFLQRKADGKFHEVKPRQGIYRSKVLKGFWLRLNWLWRQTRPKKAQVFAEIIRSMQTK